MTFTGLSPYYLSNKTAIDKELVSPWRQSWTARSCSTLRYVGLRHVETLAQCSEANSRGARCSPRNRRGLLYKLISPTITREMLIRVTNYFMSRAAVAKILTYVCTYTSPVCGTVVLRPAPRA